MCSPERFVNLQSNKSCNLLPSNHCHFSMWIDTVIWLFAACPGIVCPTTFLRGSTALSPDAGDSAGQGKRRCWFVGGFWWFDIGRSISKMIVKTLSTKEGTQMQAVRSFISALHNPADPWLQDASGSVGAAAAAEVTCWITRLVMH